LAVCAIIVKRAVRLSSTRLTARVRFAMNSYQDGRAAKGHSQVSFDEPSSDSCDGSAFDDRCPNCQGE
jgi:hypothetical protein